jgi:hypothetical protein
VAYDRKAQTQTTVRARDALVLLPESLEDVRLKRRRNPHARICDGKFDA